MNTNQLKYFIAVADNHSFTKAAKQYYLTQTALTQQIQALEAQIGVQLIDRSSRPIELTPAGRAFYTEANDILNRFYAAVQNTRDASRGASGTLQIGYAKTFENSQLPERFLSFHQKYPNIHMKLFCSESDQLIYGLLNKEYDITFTWDSTNITLEDAFETRVVEKITSVVLLYTSHPFAKRDSLSRRDLKGEKLFFLTPSSTGYSFADTHYINLYQEAGYQPDIVMRSRDLPSVLMMVALEQGIALIPSYCMKQIILYDNLVAIPMTGNDEYMLAGWRTDNENPALECFLGEFEDIETKKT